LEVELLERRDTPSSLSVSDVTVREGPTSTGVLDSAGAAAVGLSSPRGLTFDTNPADAHYGDLFVASCQSNSVARFDWATQTYQPFVSPGSGGLYQPIGPGVGPDGNLYVFARDSQNNQLAAIFRYDGATGAPLPAPGRPGAVYVEEDPNTSAGLGNVSSLAFGADGNLYVTSAAPTAHRILRFQGPGGTSPGAFMDVFVNITNITNGPNTIVFGPDGSLYANCTVSGGSDVIERFDGTTGAPIGDGVFVAPGSGGLSGSRQFVIDPLGKYLYIGEISAGQILRFQGPNGPNPGAFVDTYITQGQSALANPVGVALDTAGNLYVGERDLNQITRFAPNAQATFTVALNSPSNGLVSVQYATANGSAMAGADYTQTSGALNFPAGVTSQTLSVPVTTLFTGGPTKTFTMNLSAASGATISRAQATGSILNRMTKFFVVDGNTPRTYQYGSGGTSEEITPEASGNTAPRGVTTTAAGDKVWVVDVNKTVYVYTNHGVLLGSWAVGGLNLTAQIEGIATNGNDIWIVDAKQDKVFRYTGAASRLSGSQNAASSFSLNSANSNPKDIVTDGTSIWVVNDSTTDKVFKYNLSGTLLGSWTIDAANAHPTGITINPANVSDIWLVDNGTLKVYQYTAAAGRTSGNQNAGATFGLNPYDTNPQGIADPPPANAMVPQTPMLASESVSARGQSFTHAISAMDTADWRATLSGVPSVGSLTTFPDGLDQRSVPKWRVLDGDGKAKDKGTSFPSQRADDGAGRAPQTEALDPVTLDQVFADLV
jgi:hypothetical protein